MNDDIRGFMFLLIGVLLVLFIAFCGAALCIHVYGMHWAPIQVEAAE
jgi:hypothetical protein